MQIFSPEDFVHVTGRLCAAEEAALVPVASDEKPLRGVISCGEGKSRCEEELFCVPGSTEKATVQHIP